MKTLTISEMTPANCQITTIPVVHSWSGERMGILITAPQLAEDLVKTLANDDAPRMTVTGNFRHDGTLRSITFTPSQRLV